MVEFIILYLKQKLVYNIRAYINSKIIFLQTLTSSSAVNLVIIFDFCHNLQIYQIQ